MNLFTIVAFKKSEDGYFNGLIQELSWEAFFVICCWADGFFLVQGFQRLMSIMSELRSEFCWYDWNNVAEKSRVCS